MKVRSDLMFTMDQSPCERFVFPTASLETDDIGAISNMTELHDGMVYAIVEVPLKFTIKEPVGEGDRTMDIDLTKGYHLMCAAGDMDETGQEPLRHRKVKCS